MLACPATSSLCLIEILVRVQNLVAEKLVSLAVEAVGTRFRAEVHDAAGELAELRSQVVVLDLEFADRILSRNNDGEIDVADVERLAVEVLRALIAERASYLVIAPAKRILADGSAARSALRNRRGRNRDQVENVAAIQRKFVGLALLRRPGPETKSPPATAESRQSLPPSP